MSELITKLDDFDGLDWRVELISNVPSYYILQSVKAGAEKPEVQLWIQKRPFQITAIRPVKNSRIVEKFSMPSTIDEAIRPQVDFQPLQGVEKAVIWKTKPKPLKFNEFNCMIVAADKISELLNVYTSIVGCYGYDTKEAVLQCAQNYRDAQFPLDAIHIDVDMQREHKTFTIDDRPGHFPKPKEMFDTLRKQGVKCCTNITPHINSAEDPEYTTLNELLDNNYYIEDRRDLAKSDLRPWQDRYHYWDYDKTDLSVTYNAGKPFHGGVYYGWGNGAPGYYPNLNNHEVREWWGKQFKYLFECGVEFIWQDMTSPCIAPEYGDMKSFPFRLLLDSDVRLNEPYEEVALKRKAIEIWALYSYNLYEATFNGLQNLHLNGTLAGNNDELTTTNQELTEGNELSWRKGRRNFIIGRGSYIGSHKFAGLWTGDNASTWDFLSTSVVQVLGLGLSGNAISGQDVGGFEFIEPDHNWANPELLIRWYGAYSLLPWFRNHYTKYRTFLDGPHKGEMRKDGKQFQEPYAYDQHYRENMHHFHDPREAFLFRAVLPIITDDQDATLFFENKWFTNDQYLVGNDILVAPPLRAEAFFDRHEVYLPYPDEWFPINLYPDEPLGTALNPAIEGGSRIFCKCNISLEDDHIPRITPMYIREGAIIPKIETRASTPDWYPNGYPHAGIEMKAPEANPITFHVYPGKDNIYTMYIDDGISTDSEPLSKIPNLTNDPKLNADKYCEVRIKQVTMINTEEKCTRVLTIEAIRNGYEKYEQIVGGEYKVVFWHKESAYSNDIVVGGSLGPMSVQHLERIRATVVKFATDIVHTKGGITITLTYDN
ncbi:alpha-glucosidase 2 [Trichoderma asperellum]|uniref:alpha-glucosidase n=1 Tax=Trichoderma asperellum TaxID=101201 RepID=A0A6V8QN63_TRIAP|nr:alpha-glucosidase 2 [Trichoderma asperellum]